MVSGAAPPCSLTGHPPAACQSVSPSRHVGSHSTTFILEICLTKNGVLNVFFQPYGASQNFYSRNIYYHLVGQQVQHGVLVLELPVEVASALTSVGPL